MRKWLWTKAKNFFLDNINWCHPTLSNGQPKGKNILFDAYALLYWPIPEMDEPCWCCASVRGVIYGVLIGWLIWGL